MSENHTNYWGNWDKRPFHWRIPLLFGLLGGGLGGLFFAFMNLPNILLFIVLGAIYGFIPALITGLLAMLLKSERDVLGIVATVAIGTLSSWLYGFIFLSTFVFSGVAALLGGLSALILSFFVLPIPQENTPTPPINSE